MRSERLLNAIFAHTNKLTWGDRQIILRFLAGEEAHPPATLNNMTSLPSVSVNSNSASNNNIDDDGVIGGLPAIAGSRTTRSISSGVQATAEGENTSRVANSTTSSSPVRQILLHEERRVEFRPINTRVPDDLAHIPTSYFATDDAPEGMRAYTIVDQIIFEMDFSNGCWKKLRRRIRLADRKHEYEGLDANGNPNDASTRNRARYTPSSASTASGGGGSGRQLQVTPRVNQALRNVNPQILRSARISAVPDFDSAVPPLTAARSRGTTLGARGGGSTRYTSNIPALLEAPMSIVDDETSGAGRRSHFLGR